MRLVISRQMTVTLVILACGLVPDQLSGEGASRLFASLKSNLLNRGDLEKIERGYYQQLLDPSRRLDDLADVPGLRLRGGPGSTWSVPFDDAPLVMRVDDLREVELKRNDDTTKKGVRWQTNSHGMRDQEYALDKPAGTFRIALVGDSIGAGWGVDAKERFESILERVWNARAEKASGMAVEIINTAVPAHSPGQRWSHFSQVGWPMNPDMVIYESSAADVGWDERRLRFLLARGIGWDSPIYSSSLSSAGIDRLGSPDYYKRSLRPLHWDILTGVYRTIADDCRTRGVPIVWVLIPRVGRPNDEADNQALKKTAQAVGFSRIVDVTDAYQGLDSARLAVDADDFHPNALAHARLAERLDGMISELPELRPLWASAPGRAGMNELAQGQELTKAHEVNGGNEIVVPESPRAGEPR